jgi:hypothetical protein
MLAVNDPRGRILSRRFKLATVDFRGRRPSRMRSARLAPGFARITESKAWSDLTAG